jgi:hypothetical protein
MLALDGKMMAITDLLRWSGIAGVVAVATTIQPATAQSPRAVVELSHRKVVRRVRPPTRFSANSRTIHPSSR